MHRLEEIGHKIRYANPTMTEIMIGLIGIGWGWAVLNPWFDATQTSRTLQDLTLVAPKEIWGGAIIILSLMMIFAPSKSTLRNASSIVNFFFWVLLAASAFFTSYASLAAPMYVAIASGCFWTYSRRVGILADPNIHLVGHVFSGHNGFTSRDRISYYKRPIRVRK
jgi:hypothetical protein